MSLANFNELSVANRKLHLYLLFVQAACFFKKGNEVWCGHLFLM